MKSTINFGYLLFFLSVVAGFGRIFVPDMILLLYGDNRSGYSTFSTGYVATGVVCGMCFNRILSSVFFLPVSQVIVGRKMTVIISATLFSHRLGCAISADFVGGSLSYYWWSWYWCCVDCFSFVYIKWLWG